MKSHTLWGPIYLYSPVREYSPRRVVVAQLKLKASYLEIKRLSKEVYSVFILVTTQNKVNI